MVVYVTLLQQVTTNILELLECESIFLENLLGNIRDNHPKSKALRVTDERQKILLKLLKRISLKISLVDNEYTVR